MNQIFDISLPIGPGTACWPGDTAFRYDWNWRMEAGASVNVGSLTASVHFGTHVDAPFHFDPAGGTVDSLALEALWGEALVLDLTERDLSLPIAWDAFSWIDFARVKRLLLKTSAWSDLSAFPDHIPILSLVAAKQLAAAGILLFGIDLPSVDPIDSTDLPNHHALTAQGACLLESVDLRGVPAGEYELSALPLRVIGADGAPVRAALRRASV